MLVLKCQCCGFEREFEGEHSAFQAGWDAPPYFPYVSCDLCPGVCIALGASHKEAHALWEIEGRPIKFTAAKCAVDEHMPENEQTSIT
jgi:hypothetical protein